MCCCVVLGYITVFSNDSYRRPDIPPSCAFVEGFVAGTLISQALSEVLSGTARLHSDETCLIFWHILTGQSV